GGGAGAGRGARAAAVGADRAGQPDAAAPAGRGGARRASAGAADRLRRAGRAGRRGGGGGGGGRARAAARGRLGRGRVGGRVIRLAVRVARDHAEPVLAELLDLVPAGLEEREVDAGTVEFVLYGAAGELPALPDVRAAAGGALVDVSTSELPDDW